MNSGRFFKTTSLLAIVVLGIGTGSSVRAENAGTLVDWKRACAGTAGNLQKEPVITDPILMWDIVVGASKPINLRLSGDLKGTKDAGKYNLTGLNTLRASGSSAYSTRGLSYLLHRIERVCGGDLPKVTVFDLRQEFHGFFDGESVSWCGTHNRANKGKTHDQVVDEERALLQSISKKPIVEIAVDAHVSSLGDLAPRQSIVVREVQSEQQFNAMHGLEYVRLTVTDQMGPEPEDVDLFLEAVRKLPKDAWVHFHCHAGQGRTTTFFLLYDILRNAHQEGLTLEDMSKRQGALTMLDSGGDPKRYDLLNLDYSTLPDWKRQPTIDRTEFIRKFYDFVLQADPLRTGAKWSEWIKR